MLASAASMESFNAVKSMVLSVAEEGVVAAGSIMELAGTCAATGGGWGAGAEGIAGGGASGAGWVGAVALPLAADAALTPSMGMLGIWGAGADVMGDTVAAAMLSLVLWSTAMGSVCRLSFEALASLPTEAGGDISIEPNNSHCRC